MDSIGSRQAYGYTNLVLAETYFSQGKLDDAEDCVPQLHAYVEQSGDANLWPTAYWRAAETDFARNRAKATKAEGLLQDALRVAREQEYRGSELRAAVSMARLWQAQGKTRKAHDLLGGIYGWFTEGFEGADLKDAKALLDELK